MEDSLPLNLCHVQKLQAFINRLHSLLHSISLAFLFYYRASSFFLLLHEASFFPFLLIFFSEAILSFIWLLSVSYRWRPLVRTTFPERLPEDGELPPLDVFICTTDPSKEPTEQVMNTVVSAMALDYPPEKLHVYLSNDGGSLETLSGLRAAWRFARWWLPFCRRYRLKSCCPRLYFSEKDSDGDVDIELMAEKQKVKEKYEAFKEEIRSFKTEGDLSSTSQDHPSKIEVMGENAREVKMKMPLVVYVSREKRASHPHHFKAGALNVLLRVSGVMSNAPYFLVLDCDMMCNDPTSAKQAMCFHLDPKISPSLAFVQFPQKFRRITKNDIYDCQIRSVFKVQWQGMDGLQGPVLSGTCFYAKRAALWGNYSTSKDNMELVQLQHQFGSSNEFIKSLSKNYTPPLVSGTSHHELSLQDIKLLASCDYETSTKWGQEVGFLYASVLEDVLTSFFMHCNGWRSVFCYPPKAQFLGTATTNLNDLLIQGTRWSSGLIEIALSSKFSPLLYGLLNMSLLQSSCYAEFSVLPLYCLPICCLAIIPQLCLLHGIPLYPKVSDPCFFIFVFIFLSAQGKHLEEVLKTGGSFRTYINEQRMWMIRSTTCHLYGSLNAILNSLNLKKSTFLPTNKEEEEEEEEDKEQTTARTFYQMDMFDFRTSHMFLVPMLAFVSINVSCFIGGLCRLVVCEGNCLEDMLVQILISGFVIVVNYPFIEGLVLRKDKGRVPPSVVPSVVALFLIIHVGFMLLLRIW